MLTEYIKEIWLYSGLSVELCLNRLYLLHVGHRHTHLVEYLQDEAIRSVQAHGEDIEFVESFTELGNVSHNSQ